MASVPELKAAQRAAVRARLLALAAPERAAASAAIAARLRALPAWKAQTGLALFLPFGAEPDCGPPPGPAAYPRVAGDGIELAWVEAPADPASWAWAATPRGHRFRQPQPGARRAAPEEISLIVLPGVAFDRERRRLGRGGGWYDRLLSQLPSSALKVGLFFACQELAEVASEGHDRRLDMILTESEAIARP